MIPMDKSLADLYRQSTRAALLGLLVNFGLGVIKLFAGLIGWSFALVADALNSFADSLTSVVVLLALRIAQRPSDERHPYGYTRVDGIAATNVALTIILFALFLGWEAINRNTPDRTPPVWTLWIAAGNALIKESLYQYKVRVGRRVGSAAIVANAWDHRSDAFCSLAVLAGLATIRFAGPDYLWVDKAAALVVVGAIIWSGVHLFRYSASELLDLQAGDELVGKIRTVAKTVSGVRGIETLLVRKAGLEYLVDIHVEVHPELTVAEGHEIGHRVKDELITTFPVVRDVLVHLEPFGTWSRQQSS
jgi:cation diffusion facilitator family transporter